MDSLPFVSVLGISVLEKPIIDFELRPLKGIDLSVMIPGFSTWVNELINIVVVEGMLLSPKELELDIPALTGMGITPPPIKLKDPSLDDNNPFLIKT